MKKFKKTKEQLAVEKQIEKNLKETKKALKEAEKQRKKLEKKANSLFTEFKKFVAKGNIVDLAVAVIVGAAFNKVVNTLVSAIITPLTSLLLPTGNDYSQMKWVLRKGVEANEELGIEEVAEIAVDWGSFLEALINFLIVSVTLFLIIRTFLKIKDAINKKETEAEKAKKEEEDRKKKEAADAEAAKLEKIKKDFIDDVATQANELEQIKEILLRMEKNGQSLK